ncbi:hypothetical protein QBC35DRAFT_544336, partial [Podospora australis]
MAPPPASWAILTFLLISLPLISGQQLAAACTTNSFTIPSWLIENFQAVSATNATAVSFVANNRATNTSTELRCRIPGNATATTWQTCTVRGAARPVSASLQLADKVAARIQLNETWTCNDLTPARPLTFTATAVGEPSLPIICATDARSGTEIETCISATDDPLMVKASLSSPIQATPGSVGGPLGHDTRGCSNSSRLPSWEVSASQLNLRNISGVIEGGTAFLQIRNKIMNYTANCGGQFDGNRTATLSCTAQTSVTKGPRERYAIATTGTFNPITFARYAMFGTGSAQIPFQCEVFSPAVTFCTGDPYSFSGRLVNLEPLPPYSLRDPSPVGESCTISSIVAPAFRFSDFETVTTPGQSLGSIRFGIELQTGGQFTGFPSTVSRGGISGLSPTDIGPAWYPCTFESIGEQSLTPTNCAFRYDADTGVLGVNADWRCNDLDAAKPVSFTGEVRTQVPSLMCTTTGGRTRCTTVPGQPWSGNVTEVFW